MTSMSPRVAVLGLCLVALLCLPAATIALQTPYYLALVTRVLIFALAALSLDLVLGYGGMVSFGHAAFLGVGGYAVGILSSYGITDGFVHLGAAVGASALVALVVGALSVRTTGVSFIMITLAFSQMLYYLAISIDALGGDDGMTIPAASVIARQSLGSPVVLYYVALLSLVGCLAFFQRLVGSWFGMVVRGIASDERRMVAVGFSPFRYKLTAFVISGAVCGLAGALLADQTLFISPAIMHWSRSGEVMVMVILGGLGSLFGPILGSAIYLVLEDALSRITTHWQVLLGPLLLLVVLYANRGVFGLLGDERGTSR